MYSEEIARQYSINYNPQVHGTSGPVQVSYPKYFYPQSGEQHNSLVPDFLKFGDLVNFFDALNYLGVPTEFDPNDGNSAGAAFVPTDIDPNNQTRSDARRAYFDPYTDRDNFQVVTGQHVTRILIDGVAGNQASGPMSGGNSDGDGYASSNTDGFGFSPIETGSPVGNQENSRRRDNIEANLKITGVEVFSYLQHYGFYN